MALLLQLNDRLNHLVWGPAMFAFILFSGVYFTVGTGFFQFRHFGTWMRSTLFAIFFDRNVRDKNSHAISQFQALSTALAGTIGTGNIVGVATALVAGGPGAIFWMWVCAFFGMMTKYAENVLGNKYRYQNENGVWKGGPMVYIERGLHCKWLAALFSVFCALAAFGIGNMTQSNSIASALSSTFHIAPAATGIFLTVIVGIVLLGGIGRISAVTERFVPFMAVFYLAGSGVLLWIFRGHLLASFSSIFTNAFQTGAVAGGAGGYAVMQSIRYGIARSIFSNEAGLGSSVIVNSASNVQDPVRQGMWGIFEVFVTTLVICTITALSILCTGALQSGTDGAALTITAFSGAFGRAGGIFLTVAIVCFAFSTILGWSFYGERAMEYLFGDRFIPAYRIVFVTAVFFGCLSDLKPVWAFSDTCNGLMAVPNLIAILFLSREVFSLTKSPPAHHPRKAVHRRTPKMMQ